MLQLREIKYHRIIVLSKVIKLQLPSFLVHILFYFNKILMAISLLLCSVQVVINVLYLYRHIIVLSEFIKLQLPFFLKNILVRTLSPSFSV